jgi:hypothetical protein
VPSVGRLNGATYGCGQISARSASVDPFESPIWPRISRPCSREEREMQSIAPPRMEPPTPNNAAASRLRTVTGNRFPRKCACGCGQPIPRDLDIRYVVDFGAPRPYPAYLREHSPDFGTYRGGRAPPRRQELDRVPGFTPASEIIARKDAELAAREESRLADPAHVEADSTPTPESGRPWASGQLVFNAGSFESARSAFADYAKDGETHAQLRARVNRVILEDLEQKVLALRALHAKLRDLDGGETFGDVVARSRPRPRGECGD